MQTRYGYVRTDHILFIAAGRVPRLQAVATSSPSCRAASRSGWSCKPLTEADFIRIMTEPENAITKQYQALVAAEGGELEFTEDGHRRGRADRARWPTSRMENIGARRLHTVMATLMEDMLFDLPELGGQRIVFTRVRSG